MYLYVGTGNPCAGQNRVRLSPWIRSYQASFDSLENFGFFVATGSNYITRNEMNLLARHYRTSGMTVFKSEEILVTTKGISVRYQAITINTIIKLLNYEIRDWKVGNNNTAIWYLVTGTGCPCALHGMLTSDPRLRTKENVLTSPINAGALLPIGSKRGNKGHRRHERYVRFMWLNIPRTGFPSSSLLTRLFRRCYITL